jgi:hypothetical protein
MISRTFKIRGALVFLCPKEGEERRETRDERRETSERENKSAGDYLFLNCLGQNEKSTDFTGKSGIVCI